MVKIVDNYVLERVIGKGQYGEVYKGFRKDTNEDVAIKAVNRQNLKGKFYELLENEIKVLRSCDNINIIKLYDIKKTSNNIYLMIEYCNEGDLMQFLKKRGRLTEEETIDIFLQIINAFKTLVKNKIMHRDFKLANILKHNGVIKIADFGFSKILGDDAIATTMLGSPLNMAPEILGGKDYNSKADIWSIGTCIYELLFGRPPYTAKNIVELLNKIQKSPFSFPSNSLLSPTLKDVITKMLVFNPNDRLDWEELFNHQINKITEEKIMLDLEETMKNNNISNISRFYINNNKVIDNVAEIEKKNDINNYAIDSIKNKSKGNEIIEQFSGNYVNRTYNRDNEDNELIKQKIENENNGNILDIETDREKTIKMFKFNSSKLLHERNKYVFMASVAEDSISFNFRLSELVGYILIKKLFGMICQIKQSIDLRRNDYNLELWEEYIETKDFKKICNYINKEFDLFKNYYENLNDTIIKKKQSNEFREINFELILKTNKEEDLDYFLKSILKEYIESIVLCKDNQYNLKEKEYLIHINQLVDSLNSKIIFVFNNDASKQFNFKIFYEEIKQMNSKELYGILKSKLEPFKIVLNNIK